MGAADTSNSFFANQARALVSCRETVGVLYGAPAAWQQPTHRIRSSLTKLVHWSAVVKPWVCSMVHPQHGSSRHIERRRSPRTFVVYSFSSLTGNGRYAFGHACGIAAHQQGVAC